MRVAVVYNEPVKGTPDSEDVRDEVDLVISSLQDLGHDYKLFPVESYNGRYSIFESVFFFLVALKEYLPDVVFNLVEGTMEDAIYQTYFPLIFQSDNYPFTGSDHEALLATTDKSLSKWIMGNSHIQTPPYDVYRGGQLLLTVPGPWIVKPAAEDASIGIGDASVFKSESRLLSALPGMYEQLRMQPLIIEQYIDGREFNVSLLETGDGGVEVLPVAEIIFNAWPAGKPRIVGYDAKWKPESFECKNTIRKFNPDDAPLSLLMETALKCWKVFRLRGYARVDIRLGTDGKVYVLEANANPCISPDSGFIASLREAGYPDSYFINTVLDVSMR